MPPVNTTDEWWSYQPPGAVSATSLHQYAYSISTFGGSRFGLPTMRGQNIPIAYRAGQAQRAKYPDQRTISLVMYVAGIDPSTSKPAVPDQRLAFNDNWQALRQLFWNAGPNGSLQGTLTRQWSLGPQGSAALVSASALAEVAGSMEPTMTGRYRADFTVDLLLSDPYFYGAAQTTTLTYNSPTVVTNPGEGVAGSGFPSSLNGFTVTFIGPLTQPTLVNSSDSCQVSVNLTMASGYSVTLDVLNDTAFDNATSPVNQIANVTHAGARPWMTLHGAGYDGTGHNTLTLTSLNGADTGTCIVSFNPPYV